MAIELYIKLQFPLNKKIIIMIKSKDSGIFLWEEGGAILEI